MQGPDCGVGKLGICSTFPGALTYKAFLYYLFINYVVEKSASMFKSEQGERKSVDVNPLWSHLKAKMNETDRDVIPDYTIYLSPKTSHEYLNM